MVMKHPIMEMGMLTKGERERARKKKFLKVVKSLAVAILSLSVQGECEKNFFTVVTINELIYIKFHLARGTFQDNFISFLRLFIASSFTF
jgi:hypothetical protein